MANTWLTSLRRLSESKRSSIIRPLVYFIAASYVFANLFNVVPLAPPVPRTMSFVYPTPINGDLTKGDNFLIAQVTLSANETIAENVPVLLSNGIGSMGSAIARNISAVAIGFYGANQIGSNGIIEKPIGNPFGGILLIRAPFNISLPGLPITFGGPDLVGDKSVIVWSVPGDYHATLLLYPYNGSIVPFEYPENRIYVESSVTIQEERSVRNEESIGIAGFVLVLFEGLNWFVHREKGESPREIESINRIKTNTNQEHDTSTEKSSETASNQRSATQKHRRKRRDHHQTRSRVDR